MNNIADVAGYKIIREGSTIDLEDSVRLALRDGWLLFGPATSYSYGTSNYVGYMQTVVKLKPNTNLKGIA